MKSGFFAALALAATLLIGASAAAEPSEGSYLDRLVGRDFVACLPDVQGGCPEGGVIPVGVRTTDEGRVLFKMYGTEFARVKEFRAPLYDFELYRDEDGLHMMAGFLVRPHDATETASSIEFAYRDRLVTIFERDGHPVLRETKSDGSKVFHEVNLMPPEMAGSELAGKFAAMRAKYGEASASYRPARDTALASAATAIVPRDDVATWGYIARLAGRDYIWCESPDPAGCRYYNPALVREVEGGFVIDENKAERRFVMGASGKPVVHFEGFGELPLVTASPLETVLRYDDNLIVYTEINGIPARMFVRNGIEEHVAYYHDIATVSDKFAKKIVSRHARYGAPSKPSPVAIIGQTGPTVVRIVGEGDARRLALAKAEAAAAQRRAASAGSDDGSHARSVRKGLGGVLGGVLGTLAGAQLGMGMSTTQAIATTVATATAGALVGSGEISPEDALAATAAVTTGMAQGYADAGAQNARTAAVMAQARAADEAYAARQDAARIAASPNAAPSSGENLLRREQELAAQLAAVRELRSAQERAAPAAPSGWASSPALGATTGASWEEDVWCLATFVDSKRVTETIGGRTVERDVGTYREYFSTLVRLQIDASTDQAARFEQPWLAYLSSQGIGYTNAGCTVGGAGMYQRMATEDDGNEKIMTGHRPQ